MNWKRGASTRAVLTTTDVLQINNSCLCDPDWYGACVPELINPVEPVEVWHIHVMHST
jgi:hypothetical protein